MTRVVGLTGGIGTGKTTVSAEFARLGVPVYIADDAARRISTLPQTQQKILDAFGFEIQSPEGYVDRKKLAAVVFADPQKLAMLNAIIHPLVASDFREWVSQQNAPFVIREAAILFESGSHVDCDKVIVVTAPLETRIARVMQRDGVNREEVMARIANQWGEAQKIALSDYVIVNTEIEETNRQIRKIFTDLQHL